MITKENSTLRNAEPVLLHKSDGKALSIRTYRYGDYYIKIFFDGVDVICSAEHVALATPVLKRQSGEIFLDFTMGFYTGDLEQLVSTIKDLQYLEKQFDRLIPWDTGQGGAKE